MEFDRVDAPALHCVRCGYALVGLVHQRCPECGKEQVHSRLLRYADPAWVRSLILGGRLARSGGIAAVVLFPTARPIGNALRRSVPFLRSVDPVAILSAAALAAMVVAAVGAWLLARPDPAQVEDPAAQRRSLRLHVGLLSVLGLAAARVTLDVLLPLVVSVSLTVLTFILAIAVIRTLGGVVRALRLRCEEPPDHTFDRAGRGGGCLVLMAFIFLGFWAPLSVLNLLGGGTPATVLRGEVILIALGFIAVALGFASLGRAMNAVGRELACATNRSE